MQRPTHRKTVIAMIREQVEDWRKENRWSRETVADLIVQAHERLDGHRITGIEFNPPTTDTFERMRVNADRIFRWLDDTTKDKNLLPANFALSVLAALPLDRRTHLADDLLAQVGLVACPREDDEAPDQTVVEAFTTVVEHSANAQVALATMIDGIDPGEPERAHKKLTLAAGAFRRALGLVNRIIKRGGNRS